MQRTVAKAADGKYAPEAMERDYYDPVISDIMMPVMDGYELVRTLRDSGSRIPVLMITAKDAFDDMRVGFMSGTDDYMAKPVKVSEMLLRVGAPLRRTQTANERRPVIGDTVTECDSLTVSTDDFTAVLPQKEFMLLYKTASFHGKNIHAPAAYGRHMGLRQRERDPHRGRPHRKAQGKVPRQRRF